MLASLLLAAAAAPAAPVPPGAAPSPTGPAPVVVYLHADATGQVPITVTQYRTLKRLRQVLVTEDGKQVQKQVEEEFRVPATRRLGLAELSGTFSTADGSALTVMEAARRVKDGAVVLVSADGKPVEKGWLRAVYPDTVVIAAEALAGIVHVHPAGGGPATAAPRLELLAPDPDGKVRVACGPAGDGHGVVRDPGIVIRGNVAVAGGNVVVGGAGAIQLAPAADARAPAAPDTRKPLDEVKFDAYTTDGKPVPREESLKRLRAGGLVLVSADNRLPDAAYLKPFKPELLVLVSAELVGPPGGGTVPSGVLRPAPVPALVPAAVNVAPAIKLQVQPRILVLPAPDKKD
jgi:hypothetical protein